MEKHIRIANVILGEEGYFFFTEKNFIEIFEDEINDHGSGCEILGKIYTYSEVLKKFEPEYYLLRLKDFIKEYDVKTFED